MLLLLKKIVKQIKAGKKLLQKFFSRSGKHSCLMKHYKDYSHDFRLICFSFVFVIQTKRNKEKY